MITTNIVDTLTKIGIVPVVQIGRAESAVQLADALIAGGVNCAEITFRTEAAEDSIRMIAQAKQNMIVGAGTVLAVEQVKRAVAAGAQFIVSPGFNPKVVQYCVDNGIPIIPGASNTSDIERALEFGLSEVKFFPAEASGGLKYLRAVSAPYKSVRFMPTGGINGDNLNDYLSFDRVFACGGSWMVGSKLINSGDFATIEKLTREAVSSMLGYKLAHVGINSEDSEQAQSIASLLCSVLGMPLVTKPESFFAGDAVEVMRAPYFGENGHIGIKCNSLDRAIYYMENKGLKFRPDGFRTDSSGKITVAYLQQEFGGFAIHLVE